MSARSGLARLKLTGLFVAAAALVTSGALASDACSSLALEATADVTVSDGDSYQTHAYYHAPNNNSISFLRAENEHFGIEGPYGWYNMEERKGLVGPPQKIFALGHQFHAMLLYYDEIMLNKEPATDIAFDGGSHSGKGADFPHGGRVWLVDGEAPDRPAGMHFMFPETTPIDAIYSDWTDVSGQQLPMNIKVIHEGRIFIYAYTDVTIEDRSPLWFMEAVPVRNIDELKAYRLHRRLMAAHCLGAADLIGQLTAEETLIANRGTLSTATGAETAARFKEYFSAVTHSSYKDLQEPVIEISESGDIGWVAVNVGVEGTFNETGDAFANEWAWIMLVKKIDGEWKNAGNASSVKGE